MSKKSNYPVQFVFNTNDNQETCIKYLNNCTINGLLTAAKSELSEHQFKNNNIFFKDFKDIDIETNSDLEDAFDYDNYTDNNPLRLKIIYQPQYLA